MIPVAPSTDPNRLLTRAMGESVQVLPETSKEGITNSGFGFSTSRGSLLPAVGTRAREYALRQLYRMDEMAAIQGSFAGICKAVAGLNWEIKGDETPHPLFGEMAAQQGWRLSQSTGVEYFQTVLRQANFGAGWGTLMTQWFNDFLRYDAGGYVEVIAAGEAYDRPLGPITGIAHLDPLRCYPTGDPRYPVVYYDRYGGLHVLHRSRVMRMVDMDDGDDLIPGYGQSALSRAVSIAWRQVWEARYINMRLDDTPPPGLTIVGGITKGTWDAEQKKFESQQNMDRRPRYGQRQFYFTVDMEHMPKVESYEFQSSPEKFDWPKYLNVDIDMLALAIGVDRQELMQLSGGNIGSAHQSEILHQKAGGKTIGYFIQETTRRINDLLPEGYEFAFKPRDNAEALEEANKGQVWVNVVKDAPLSQDEKRTLLANQVDAVRDAITNTPRANDLMNQPLVAADNTVGAAPMTPMATPDVPAQPSLQPVQPTQPPVQKDYATTEAAFVQEVTNLLTSSTAPTVYIRLDRAGFSIQMRSLLHRYGLAAIRDGLAAGGVVVDTLDPEDMARYLTVFAEQSAYIGGLADDVYKNKTITPQNAHARALLWGKSLQAFNDAGLMSADANGMYRWQLGDAEHCKDCQRLSNQVHRIKTWTARGLTPRASRLACRGYNCKCSLVRTSEKARGRF